MPTLADLVASYTRTPSAAVYLDGKRWYGVQKLSFHQKFKEQIASGTVEGRNPPVSPRIGMAIRWDWGYNGVHVAGFTGEVSSYADASYPDRVSIQCSDVLWRADKSSQVLATSPLNDILASDAVRYLLSHYGGISASRLSIPTLPASGAAWVGSEWVLGTLTPVQWGDSDTESGGTTALRAAAEICSALGFWLYADSGGTVRAKQMEKKPSPTAREVFKRAINLLVNGAPERQQSYENVYNQVTVRGADTGVDGAQLWDQRRTTSSLLPSGVYRDFPYSSFLLEYENAGDAGAASVSSVATRILNVVSRVPDVVPLRAKADPNRKVGDTVGIIDTGIAIPTQRNFFLYEITRTLDLTTGAFDDQLSLDGGTGSTGYTTLPPPDASFSWTLMAETLDATAVVEVALDGSGSSSPTGEIVSWAWSTSTPTYSGSPTTATGVTATLLFELADSPAVVTLTVIDTTSKTSSFEASIDLTGADTTPPLIEVLSVAGGSAWLITPDGGATWNAETTNGDAVAVGTIGAGYDDRASGTAPTYGLLATRGSGGAGGLRQTLDALATASTNSVTNAGAITSNIWVNEANPARVWFAIGTAVYRSIDGGLTKVAMHVAPVSVSWIMEDPAVDDSVFLLAGADMYHATAPSVGWALLYAGPVGATARQFVRSRDGQVTWIAYIGAPAGEALQRVENGAAADFTATDVRSLELDRNASSLAATVYGVTGDDPAELWSFDGLTGLSAVQSSQFFPGGATVQHILGSRQFDVIYCADFDSIGANQGAVRKYFANADLLLLFKALASGQQAHMLGLGGVAVAPGRVILIPFEASGAGDFIWVHETSGWIGRTPPQAGWAWVQLVANPFNGDEWLLYGRSPNSANPTQRGEVQSGVVCDLATGESPLYHTTDAGATWAPITLSSAASDGNQVLVQAKTVEWSDSASGVWLLTMGAEFITSNPTHYWRGSHGSAGTAFLEGAPDYTVLGFVASGMDGQFIVAGRYNSNRLYVIETDGTRVDVDPTDAGEGYLGIDKFPGSASPLVVGLRNINTLVASEDYRSTQPAESLIGAGTSLSAAIDGVYVGGRTGVLHVTNVLAGASGTVVAADGVAIGFVRVARQNRALATVVAARTTGVDAYVYDGTAWTLLPGPADATTVVDYVEVTATT